MLIRDLVEDIRDEASNGTGKPLPHDSYELIAKIMIVLRDIAGKEEWSFFLRHVSPIAQTATGRRDYPLPDDFGSNFLKGSRDGQGRVCKISDGSGEADLNYLSASKFFDTTDFTDTTTGMPGSYTIQVEGGRKRILLEPLPDSNSGSHYTIRGAYRPTFTDLVMDSWVPEELGSYLLYAVLIRIEPESLSFNRDYLMARTSLYMVEARDRDSRLVSVEGRFSGEPGWTPEFF